MAVLPPTEESTWLSNGRAAAGSSLTGVPGGCGAGAYLTIENFKIYARESARTEHPRASLY